MTDWCERDNEHGVSPQDKQLLARPAVRSGSNELVMVWTGFNWLWQSCKCGNEPSDYIRFETFLDDLGDFQQVNSTAIWCRG